MKISYHEDVDILTIVFKNKRVNVSEEVLPGVIVDYDEGGQVTAFEIMDVGKFTDLSEVIVFLSKWGDQDRVLDHEGNFSFSSRTNKAISAGD